MSPARQPDKRGHLTLSAKALELYKHILVHIPEQRLYT